MSQEVLYQTRFLVQHKTFTLTSSGVAVDLNGPVSRVKFEIPFEDIPDSPFEITTRSDTDLRVSILLSVVGLLFLLTIIFGNPTGGAVFFVILPISWWAKFWFSNATYWVFRCGDKSLEIFKERPSTSEVTTFIDTMQSRKGEYLKRKYLPLAGDSLLTELRQLAWLRGTGALNDEEYERIKASLVAGLNKPRSDIGFRN
jgi:hypothetical protein